MNKTNIASELLSGRNCAQCVLGCFSEELSYDVEETDRLASCFGGGMLMAQTCGAVTGALMVIGLSGAGKETARRFEQAFAERFGSCVCSDLLGGLLPGEAPDSEKKLELCPEYVETAIRILRDII